MLNKYLKVLLSSALLLTVGTSFSEKVNAQAFVNDTFTDGGLTNGADPLDISWFGISSNFYQTVSTPSQIKLSVVEDQILGSGKALNLDTPSFTTYPSYDPAVSAAHFALGTFAPVTLGSEPGDTLYLSFDFRFTTKPSTSTTFSQFPNLGASALRFGLYNSASTPVTTNILASLLRSGTPVEDDGGYFVLVGLAGTSRLEVAKENFNSEDSITGGYGGLGLISTNSLPTIDDTARHTAVLIIRRVDSQTVRITTSIDGYLVKAVDSGPGIITSFDEIAVRINFSDLNINIDNVVLQAL
ncbi:hypothetical protein [Nostoc commune]|uniref:hypothetical protein n=1 Tax=Nostoc commune TaxID=1178 RepID=UPI0018C69385|nr:hypothetical protein [Nostoc commune]MBG1262680.1 hypothetical protein [Nostoc commune BAE]